MRLVIYGAILLGCIGFAEAQEAKTVQCQKNSDVRTVTVESCPDGCRVVFTKFAQPGRELWHYKRHLETCQTHAQKVVS